MQEKINVLRRINDFAKEYDPYGYYDDNDDDLTDADLLEYQESVIDFIRETFIENYADQCLDADDEAEVNEIIKDLERLGMLEGRCSNETD